MPKVRYYILSLFHLVILPPYLLQRCGKTVYFAEKQNILKQDWHKAWYVFSLFVIWT